MKNRNLKEKMEIAMVMKVTKILILTNRYRNRITKMMILLKLKIRNKIIKMKSINFLLQISLSKQFH